MDAEVKAISNTFVLTPHNPTSAGCGHLEKQPNTHRADEAPTTRSVVCLNILTHSGRERLTDSRMKTASFCVLEVKCWSCMCWFGRTCLTVMSVSGTWWETLHLSGVCCCSSCSDFLGHGSQWQHDVKRVRPPWRVIPVNYSRRRVSRDAGVRRRDWLCCESVTHTLPFPFFMASFSFYVQWHFYYCQSKSKIFSGWNKTWNQRENIRKMFPQTDH